VAVIELMLYTLTFTAAAPPKLTVAPGANPVPEIVTEVPPLVVPDVGEIVATVGAGAVPPPERVRIVLSSLKAPGEVLR
jgi:hypothetical protein